MDEQMDGQTDRWMDGPTDGLEDWTDWKDWIAGRLAGQIKKTD